MAKITALTAATTASSDDLMLVVDDPSGTAVGKKITVANLITSIQGTTGSTVAAGNHNHSGVYEPANANIQSHIASTSNPHSTTKAQVGLTNVTDDAQLKIASNLADLSNAATARTNLGVAIGTNVQAYDATLAALASYNTNGLITQTAADTFTGRTLTGTANHVTVTNGDGVSGNPTLDLDSRILTQTLTFVVDGGGSAITTGSKGYVEVPFDCTINRVTLLADQSGSIVVDIKKVSYASFPTTASICASAKPTLSSAQKSQDATLTGWTTAITAGDILEYNVDSASTVTRVTVSLRVTK